MSVNLVHFNNVTPTPKIPTAVKSIEEARQEVEDAPFVVSSYHDGTYGQRHHALPTLDKTWVLSYSYHSSFIKLSIIAAGEDTREELFFEEKRGVWQYTRNWPKCEKEFANLVDCIPFLNSKLQIPIFQQPLTRDYLTPFDRLNDQEFEDLFDGESPGSYVIFYHFNKFAGRPDGMIVFKLDENCYLQFSVDHREITEKSFSSPFKSTDLEQKMALWSQLKDEGKFRRIMSILDFSHFWELDKSKHARYVHAISETERQEIKKLRISYKPNNDLVTLMLEFALTCPNLTDILIPKRPFDDDRRDYFSCAGSSKALLTALASQKPTLFPKVLEVLSANSGTTPLSKNSILPVLLDKRACLDQRANSNLQLSVQEKMVFVSKELLSMFTSVFNQSSEFLTYNDYPMNSVLVALEYIYSGGKTRPSFEDSIQLFALADQWGLTVLKARCKKILVEKYEQAILDPEKGKPELELLLQMGMDLWSIVGHKTATTTQPDITQDPELQDRRSLLNDPLHANFRLLVQGQFIPLNTMILGLFTTYWDSIIPGEVWIPYVNHPYPIVMKAVEYIYSGGRTEPTFEEAFQLCSLACEWELTSLKACCEKVFVETCNQAVRDAETRTLLLRHFHEFDDQLWGELSHEAQGNILRSLSYLFSEFEKTPAFQAFLEKQHLRWVNWHDAK